ncbi:MAG: EAL domain-containing protein [Treponema sp.]|nr:EAL domain-containing protein [Treponema sp.]
MNTDNTQLINKLQRALFYESQYRNAIVSDSISFYDVNISKDLLENDFFYRDKDGNFLSVLERVGLSAPCKFSLFIEKWCQIMIPDAYIQSSSDDSDPSKPKATMPNLKKYPFMENICQQLIDTFNNGKREYITEYWVDPKNGNRIFINLRYLLTKNEAGDICALSIVKDYTKHRVLEETEHRKELEYFAFVDPITNGTNYIKFKLMLRGENHEGSIVSMDIHSFKVINSICGVTRGDEVIEAIWHCIENAIDAEQGDKAAHINADHFVIYFNTIKEEEVIAKLKCITFALNMITSEMTEVPQIKPYFGVAIWYPKDKIEFAYSHAVVAKHNAKDNETVNYAFFNESDTQKLIREKEMVDSFETAIAKKEFKIWFQPKYKPISKELVGAEALVRWQKSDGTMISPGEFIPLFERNGMIRALDEYIFRNVCIMQKRWELMGKQIVPVSINISRASLYYKDVVKQYKRHIDDIGIDPKNVPIEITESAAVNNFEIKEIVDNFYDLGFSLHMDDFGSGYSSLASLNQMHFETLKLDKSLIDFIGDFGGDRLLEHTISLAKELGMHVTAEGVENEKQVLFLKHTGCDSIQGFFYSKPLPKEIFEKLIAQNNSDSTKYAVDYVAEKVVKFKQSLIRPPIYTFLVNLSKNVYTEEVGALDFEDETGIHGKNYDAAVQALATTFIHLESKQAYENSMKRENILKNFTGVEQTRFFQYSRIYNGDLCKMQIMSYIFTTENSPDVWMFFTVSIIENYSKPDF